MSLLILVVAAAESGKGEPTNIFDFYMNNVRFMHSWGLSDVSAPSIVGAYLIQKSRKPLVRLAQSGTLWEQRIAVVATQHFILRDDFDDTLKICQLLLSDEEDLIHKATGWMLREVGKKHMPTLERFLNQYASTMPRTMLRYAIERFSPEKRCGFLLRKYSAR